MSKSITLLEALEVLEEKIKKGKKHFLNDCGICENIATITGKYYNYEMKQLYPTWKNWSGNDTYPISGYIANKESETLWQGEQLKLRLALIKHMKKEITKGN